MPAHLRYDKQLRRGEAELRGSKFSLLELSPRERERELRTDERGGIRIELIIVARGLVTLLSRGAGRCMMTTTMERRARYSIVCNEIFVDLSFDIGCFLAFQFLYETR